MNLNDLKKQFNTFSAKGKILTEELDIAFNALKFQKQIEKPGSFQEKLSRNKESNTHSK